MRSRSSECADRRRYRGVIVAPVRGPPWPPLSRLELWLEGRPREGRPYRGDLTCYNLCVAEILEHLDAIAIFPLATVLFPGAILPLHIFEERYKEMMKYAVENGGMFGLSYRSDAAIGRETPPELGSVGCIAKINAVVPLDDGRMNVISTGLLRYRVVGVKSSTPFVVARVEPLTDDLEPGADLSHIFDDMADACRRFLEAAQALDEASAPINQDLPDDAESFSLLVCSALPIDNETKQTLLEMTSTRLRLTRMRQHVTAALSEYTDRITIQQRAKGNGHGKIGQQ